MSMLVSIGEKGGNVNGEIILKAGSVHVPERCNEAPGPRKGGHYISQALSFKGIAR